MIFKQKNTREIQYICVSKNKNTFISFVERNIIFGYDAFGLFYIDIFHGFT